MKPMLKARKPKRSKLTYDGPPSNFAVNFNLRRYTMGHGDKHKKVMSEEHIPLFGGAA